MKRALKLRKAFTKLGSFFKNKLFFKGENKKKT